MKKGAKINLPLPIEILYKQFQDTKKFRLVQGNLKGYLPSEFYLEPPIKVQITCKYVMSTGYKGGMITGLRPTWKPGFYTGNIIKEKTKSFILAYCYLRNENKYIQIDLYPYYYPCLKELDEFVFQAIKRFE